MVRLIGKEEETASPSEDKENDAVTVQMAAGDDEGFGVMIRRLEHVKANYDKENDYHRLSKVPGPNLG